MSMHSSRATGYGVPGLRRLRLPALLLAVGVAGCAGPMAPARVPPTPVAPVTAFDGTYRGKINLSRTANGTEVTSWCQSPGQPAITVADGQFTYAVPHPNVPGNPKPTFLATMKDDGSFFGQANNGTISGQVSGSHMQGQIDGEGCVYTFAADKQG